MAQKKDNVVKYRDEFNKWLPILQPYHLRFNSNYEKYTANQRLSGQKTKINDPVASELVERVIQKLFEREPKFFAEARGKNIPPEVKSILTAVAGHLWSNQDMVQSTGAMRNKLKVLGREFCVTGNGATEVYWNPQSDCPDMRVIPIEDIVFDPTKNLKTSPILYVRQFVSLDYLKDNVEIKKDGNVVTGIFDAKGVKKLEAWAKGEENLKKDDPTPQRINRSGGAFQRKVDRFQLISRYKRDEVCRFIIDDDLEDPVLIQEFTNDVYDTPPVQVAMDMEVVKEPYSRSFIDDLKGLFTLKNLFLNQLSDYGSKVLNPPTIVNPNVGPVNLKTVANMYKFGGIVVADPQMIDQKPIAPIGNFPHDMLSWIEQRSESVSGIGAYLAGVPNQTSDQTQGTKGGIQSLIQQAVSPVRDRQLNIEESIIEPWINKAVKMVGATMGKDEFKWVLVSGEDRKWVKVTKGLIEGKIRLDDLMQAGAVQDEELQEIVNLMLQSGKDPQKDIIFDVDWLIKVEAGSLAEVDPADSVPKIQMWADFRMSHYVPTDYKKVSDEMALRLGIKNPSQFDEPGQQPQQMRFPREVMNYKDLPPQGQEQMAQQAGIQIQPPQPPQQTQPQPPMPPTPPVPQQGQTPTQ